MNSANKKNALSLIRSNIKKFGHHIYVVSGGGQLPRYAYTIGIKKNLGVELIFAGGSVFSDDTVCDVINKISDHLKKNVLATDVPIALEGFGAFFLRGVEKSWVEMLMLGASDFHGDTNFPVLQIVPDNSRQTLDIPKMGSIWNPELEPVWRWLGCEWNLPTPLSSRVVTNIPALFGAEITEATRWEVNCWELFSGAGPDVIESDIRIVPLGMLLAIDPTLQPVVNLNVGEALWRESSADNWHVWKAADV